MPKRQGHGALRYLLHLRRQQQPPSAETRKTLSIPIQNDASPEGDETLQVTLSSPTNALLGVPSSTTLTIQDDETGGPPGDPGTYDEYYSYDEIGNLLSKGGVSYFYGTNENGTGAGPHQARKVNGETDTYDNNGNLMSGGGRTYSWNADNQPTSITSDGVTESDVYDADGERVKRTRGSTTTVYLGGLVEEELPGGATRTHYLFHGQVIAQRSKAGTQDTLLYLHSDHLGSISVATSNTTPVTVVSSQEFTPWGDIRSGGIAETSLNYTGQ